MRDKVGFFQGGEWTNSLDNFGGEKHRAMELIGIEAMKEIRSCTQLIQKVGAPDKTVVRGKVGYECLFSDADDDLILIYYWRAQHDFMYFTCSKDVLTSHSWWHAKE